MTDKCLWGILFGGVSVGSPADLQLALPVWFGEREARPPGGGVTSVFVHNGLIERNREEEKRRKTSLLRSDFKTVSFFF